MIQTILLYTLAAFFLLAGANHFRVPGFYLPMMPPYLPFPEFLNYFAGSLEIALGVLLLPERTRAWSAWGIVALLVLFLSVHVYMLQERHGKFAQIPEVILWLRLPLQAVLIGWAWWFTRG